MFGTLKKFFDFCNETERKQFYLSILLGVFNALFVAMRIPAVFIVLNAIFEGNLSFLINGLIHGVYDIVYGFIIRFYSVSYRNIAFDALSLMLAGKVVQFFRQFFALLFGDES